MTEPATSRRRAWLIPAVIALVALIGIGVGIGVAVSTDDDDDGAAVSDASRISSVQQACEDWMGSSRGPRPSSDWCTRMGGWMNDQVRSGNMQGQMMWGDPDRMRSTCRQWMSSDSTATTSAAAGDWCDDMVTWMQDHMDGDWAAWMMHGGMMSR
jgi:hypothetical protein